MHHSRFSNLQYPVNPLSGRGCGRNTATSLATLPSSAASVPIIQQGLRSRRASFQTIKRDLACTLLLLRRTITTLKQVKETSDEDVATIEREV